MALADKLKEFRTNTKLTQKDLADKLFVTPQAVSRWENGEVEPSISMLEKIADIFGVSLNELIGKELPKQEEKEVIKTVENESKHVLAVCEVCNKPIFEPYKIVRGTHIRGRHHVSWVHCSDCEAKAKAARKAEQMAKATSNRTKSFWWGGIAGVISLTIGLITQIPTGVVENIVLAAIIPVVIFTFVSCLFLDNNFVGDVTENIFSFGFVKMPGLIFSLDLDGIIWLLTVKLALFILSILLAVGFGVLALIIGGALSIVVYPFALRKNILRPLESNS